MLERKFVDGVESKITRVVSGEEYNIQLLTYGQAFDSVFRRELTIQLDKNVGCEENYKVGKLRVTIKA